jgi:hypothetical protein
MVTKLRLFAALGALVTATVLVCRAHRPPAPAPRLYNCGPPPHRWIRPRR